MKTKKMKLSVGAGLFFGAALLLPVLFGREKGQILTLIMLALVMFTSIILFIAKKLGHLPEALDPFADEGDTEEISRPVYSEQPIDIERYNNMLAHHFNAWIRDRLKQVYPDIKFEWVNTNVIDFALQKINSGRLKVFDVEPDFIDVAFDQYNRLKFTEIRIQPMESTDKEKEKPEKAPSDNNEDQVKKWYGGPSGNRLNEVISWLDSKGFTELTVDQDGKFTVQADGKPKEIESKISDFPKKNLWEHLIKMIDAEDFRGTVKDDNLIISWD